MSVATSTAIAIGIGAASAASSAYAAKRAGDTNKQSISAQERSDQRADVREGERLTLEGERSRADTDWRRKSYEDYLAQDRQRWEDYRTIYAPHWNLAAGTLNSLYGLAGLPQGGGGGGGGGTAFAPGDVPAPDWSVPPETRVGVMEGAPSGPGGQSPAARPRAARRQFAQVPMPQSRMPDLGTLLALAKLSGSPARPSYVD
jgi:hypothetical protein